MTASYLSRRYVSKARRVWRFCRQVRFPSASAQQWVFVTLVVLLGTSYLHLAGVYTIDRRWLWPDPSAASAWPESTQRLSTAIDEAGQRPNDGLLLLEEHAASLERSPNSSLQHIVILTAGLEGAVLGGGIGTAYSALARRLAAFGHTVQVLYVPYPTYPLSSSSSINHTELHKLYSAAAPSSISIDQLIVSRSTVVASTLLPHSSEQQSVVYRAVRGCSTHACVRSYHVYRWLTVHLRRVRDVAGPGVIVHVQDNAALGYFVSMAHNQRLLPTSITLVLGTHAPHLWERLANGAAEITSEDTELDRMERVTAARVDWLISPSRYMLQWMEQQNWTFPPHVAVQPNLLPLSPTTEQINDRTHHMLASNHPQVLREIVFFGRLELRKGLYLLLDAVQLLLHDDDVLSRWRNCSLLISFLGPDTRSEHTKGEWTSNTVRARCLELRQQLIDTLDLHCVLLTNMSRQESLSYLSRHPQPPPLVVIGSPIDNSPYTVLECLTLGVPFLAAAVGGIPELVHRDMQPRDAQHRLFEPTTEQLFDKLRNAVVEGVRWLPIKSRVDDERAWQRWHAALPPATNIVTSSTTGASHPLLAVCIIYPGNMEQLRAVVRTVLEQQSLNQYELQLIVVRLLDERSMPADTAEEEDTISVDIRSELTAVVKQTHWSSRLLTVPSAVFVDFSKYWQWIASRVHGDYFLFLDRQHTLYDRTSLEQMMRVAMHIEASVISCAVYDALRDDIVLDISCSQHSRGMSPATTDYLVNRSMLVSRSALPTSDEWAEIGRVREQQDSTALSGVCISEPLLATRTG